MNSAEKAPPGKPKARFPWILLAILLLGIYLFWILPYQLGPRHVDVEYEPAKTRR